MKSINKRSIPHLPHEIFFDIPKGISIISAFTISLEAWRRGLIVSLSALNNYKIYCDYHDKIVVSSSDMIVDNIANNPQRAISFKGSNIYDGTMKRIANICKNKELTKKTLKAAGVPVPEGRRFEPEVSNQEVIQYIQRIGLPVVIKPTSGSLGKGVVFVNNNNNLLEIIQNLRCNQKYPDMIVEKYCAGEEYRVFVIENQVIGVLRKIPANVVGDGISSVKELIDNKNIIRKANQFYQKHLIKIDDDLLKMLDLEGCKIDSIPKHGKCIYLKSNPNIIYGGEYEGVTSNIPKALEFFAVKAVNSIEGLRIGGVDIILNRDDECNCTVLEINYIPGIIGHIFPTYGEPVDIPSAILDYFFPESKAYRCKNRNLIYDFKESVKLIKNGTAKEVTIAPILPLLSEIYANKCIVSGKVQGVGYRRWIKKKALAKKLHGHAINLKNGSVEVLVAGNEQKSVDQFIEFCKEGPNKVYVSDVAVEEYSGPIKTGFHTNITEDELAKLEYMLKLEKKEHRKTSNELKAIKNSKIWRYSKPIRVIKNWLK